MEKYNNDIIGKTVELIYMDDTQSPEPGTKGVIKSIDGIGQIHVNWETGSTLSLVPELDQFKIL